MLQSVCKDLKFILLADAYYAAGPNPSGSQRRRRQSLRVPEILAGYQPQLWADLIVFPGLMRRLPLTWTYEKTPIDSPRVRVTSFAMLICFLGDANPRVVALQLLLNRASRINAGLTVDGHYGPKTAQAVQRFRAQIMQTSGRGDVVDGPVWLSLISGTVLQVLDIIDVTDPAIVDSIVPDVAQFTVPILIGSMSNGVGQAITEIKSRAHGSGSLLLIRFHGHGAPGLAAISHGTSRLNPGINPILAQTVFTIEVVKLLRPLLQGVAPLMHNMGFVEFHSCRVAQGQNGSSMIRDLSAIWQSPVSAGLSRQKGGGNDNFILQQPTFTSFPASATLKAWAASRKALQPVN